MSTDVQVIPDPVGDAKLNPATGEYTFSCDLVLTGAGVNPSLNGWVIQKVTIDWKIYFCEGCDCRTGRKLRHRDEPCTEYWVKQRVYLEAWQVVNGKLHHGKASDHHANKPQDTFATGDFDKDKGTPIQVCGTITITGEFQFFAAGSLDPELDPDNWKKKDKVKQSGLLPSTDSDDALKAFGAAPPVPPSREHVLSVHIDNCAHQASFSGTIARQSPKL